MWLVLCPASDHAALWAYEGLTRRGLWPLRVVTGEALAFARRVEHRLSSTVEAIRFELVDGSTLCGDKIHGVLNRLPAAPTHHLRHAIASDREYAEQELQAFFLSWLFSLPGPVVNVPTPQGLCGAWRHPAEWRSLAHQSGLPAVPLRRSDREIPGSSAVTSGPKTRSAVVLEGRIFDGNAPEYVREGCRTFARLCQTALLGIEFHVSRDGQWSLASASPLPDLRLGGEPFLDQLAETFQSARSTGVA